MNKKEITLNIFNNLISSLPPVWNGKESILFMKENGCKNWRQMEWPGWYFQFMCERILKKGHFFNIPGPRYGNVEFDGKYIIPWDFKAHTVNTSSGNKVPTNGYAEVQQALMEYKAIGFIIASGEAHFDDEKESFKKWHAALKGKMSTYEIERIRRGATSRRRKVSFELKEIRFIFVDKTTIQHCSSFQQGMRNSDGTPRNPKIMLDLTDERLEQYIYSVQ